MVSCEETLRHLNRTSVDTWTLPELKLSIKESAVP